MVKYICDRCGADMTTEHEREKTTQLPKIIIYPNNKPGQDGWVEICRHCADSYTTWLKGDNII